MTAPRLQQVRNLRYRLRPRRRPRFNGLSFNRVVPNLMTMIGLCAGLTSIRFALENRFAAAAVAVMAAACIDGLDGRLARLLKATSRFGAEFDSLTDFLCFGVAPSLVLYLWSLQEVKTFGWVAPACRPRPGPDLCCFRCFWGWRRGRSMPTGCLPWLIRRFCARRC